MIIRDTRSVFMGATSETTQTIKEEIMDDISNVEEVKVSENKSDKVDPDVLAKLKAKSQKNEENKMANKIVSPKNRAIKMGIFGSGQAGSRIAEAFFNCGYDVVICNSAIQDLKHISIPDNNKLHLEYGVGGASKELSIGY